MKKTLLGILSILIVAASVNIASAKVKATSPETAQAIKYYKSGNYVQAYLSCTNIVNKDPSNALAQYYLAMSNVQLGRKAEAIDAYDTVINLSEGTVLGSYAKKGKRCIEDPSMCHAPSEEEQQETPEDKFIKSKYGSGFSKRARGVHEKESIEDIRREINRNDEIAPDKFRNYKDFSSYAAPSNDEIVAAIRVLQRAGMTDMISGGYSSDVSGMLGAASSDRNYEVLKMLYGNNSSTGLNPQLIQSLLSTQMTSSF